MRAAIRLWKRQRGFGSVGKIYRRLIALSGIDSNKSRQLESQNYLRDQAEAVCYLENLMTRKLEIGSRLAHR